MKKFLTCAFCTLFAMTVFVFASCKKEEETEKVSLVAITGVQVGVTDGIDYYVVPEPAASAKVAAIESLSFAGNLQELYGEDGGYPQAVVVAKNSVASFCGSLMKELEGASDWLLNENTSSESIVQAVNSHLTKGMTPAFNAKNLTKTVIFNCGVGLTYASGAKSYVTQFMQKLNEVSDGFGMPADGFFHDGNFSEESYSGEISVYAPDGAPALGLAKLMSESDVRAEYHIVDPTLIHTYVTGKNPVADVCVLPVNLAVKLLGSGENYKMLGVLTHGNLFLLSANGEKITGENISSLKGKRVGVVNLPAVPGLTFKLILKNYGIEYSEAV